MNMKKIRKIAITWLLLVSLILPMVPSIDWSVFAAQLNASKEAYHFKEGEVAVINQNLINTIAQENPDFAKEPVFVIENGVFSVTVNGPFTYDGKEISVSVIFGVYNEQTKAYEGVTIDRTNEEVTDSSEGRFIGSKESGGWTKLSDLYAAGEKLGWKNGNNYYVPTAPFLITGNAKVKTLFLGKCEIKAHRNGVYLTGSNATQISTNTDRAGYAGIQVDSGSSLTITDVTEGELRVFGSYQLAGTNGYDSDPLKVNPIFAGSNAYLAPTGANYDSRAGGAGIGGGAKYNTQNSKAANYREGTPGEIIINSGKIYAVGGHLAAAIGGGFNGASTTSKIEINGGEITAIGGRFATGIGDGDTIDRQYTANRSGPSPCFGEPSKIIINGGIVKAYGGTAAAAIGTGDKVTMSEGLGENTKSGLEIIINGGYIEAQSGEADTNSWAGEVTAAAIGVGQSTYMNENSITIYSAATVFARSYSIYAISEKPITEAQSGKVVPMVNIDPDGFMYLARFSDVNYERTMTLFPVFKDTLGNPIAIETPAYNTIQGIALNPEKYYARTTATVDEKLKEVLYEVTRVGDDFVPVYDEENNLKYYSTENDIEENFSYYYDISSADKKEFVVPAQYKAVALSLGKGDYVFHVPKSAAGDRHNYENDIYCHFSKQLSGTTSVAVIEDKQKVTPYHFTYKNNAFNKTTPNVAEDTTATPFISMQLDAFNNENEKTEMMTGNKAYQATVLGYVLYLPFDTTNFNLSFTYDTANVKEIHLTYPEGLKTNDRTTLTNSSLTGTNNFSFTLDTSKMTLSANGEKTAEIWINKIDTQNQSNPYITYKITLILKSQYHINVNALSKKYDGEPVSPQIISVTEGREGEIVERIEEHVYSGTTIPIAYGSHNSRYWKDNEKAVLVYNAKIGETQTRPITIEYAAVPNETETSISLITRFTYTDGDGKEVKKRSTVNINMDEKDLVFTLDGSSDSILMASNYGNYKIGTEKGTIVDNGETWITWTINIEFYDLQQNVAKIPVLTFKAIERVVVQDANPSEIPEQTGTGVTIHKSKADALVVAAEVAKAAFAANPFETRYSDSYFYSNGKKEIQTFTMDVTHHADQNLGISAYIPDENGKPTDKAVKNFGFSIEDDYIYMYYEFHYYAEKMSSGDKIPFTKDQIAQVTQKYYNDFNGNGLRDAEDTLIGEGTSAAPIDAGYYILELDYIGEEYEAYTFVAFEIRKRPIKIIGVENWLTYLDAETLAALINSEQPQHLKTYPLNPKDSATKYTFGNVIYDDVIDGDVIELSDSVYGYYNEITVSHNDNKITLRYDAETTNGVTKGFQIDWLGDKASINVDGVYANDNRNYELTNVTNFHKQEDGKQIFQFSFVHLSGTLAYVSQGTVFKKTENEEDPWRKFWPSWDETFLKWKKDGEKDEYGNYTEPDIMEHRIDHVSPSNGSHQNLVYLRTLNADRSPTYSIDIEYGSMNFVYAKSVWDVNTHTYVSGDQSFWIGNDGITNSITIINRSDAEISFSATYEKENYLSHLLKLGFSDNYKEEDVAELKATYEDHIASAALTNKPEEKTFYFVVRGVPINANKQQIGSLILTVGPSEN